MTSNKGTSLNAAASYIFNEERVRIASLRFWLDFKIKAMQRGPFLKVFGFKRQTFWLHFLPPHWKIKILFHDYLLRNKHFISFKFTISVKWMLA